MFETQLLLAAVVILTGMAYAYSLSKDVFHPLMFVGPMMFFMYVWMPLKLNSNGGLDGFFQRDQLVFVQWINVGGVLCFVLGCLSISPKLEAIVPVHPLSAAGARVLTIGAIVLGLIGVACWGVAIINVGGIVNAFSEAYSGGWDDSGYVRDGALLMFPCFLLLTAAATREGFRFGYLPFMLFFIAPWCVQAFFTARRGPTFMISVILAMGWYMNRWKRPSLVVAGAAGLSLGLLLLLLVTNRQHIYIGSDEAFTTDVSGMVEKPDTGNEYIYGTGSILSAEARQSFYWGRRYLAQIVVRPVPRAVWPTKYEDFGLAEIEHNAGTGEGFSETLGWDGAVGSAPGVISDLWLEFRWLNLPVLWIFGRLYAAAWRKTHLSGGPWITQYVIAAALSIYFVMQTMEAVIFRLLILSIPSWFIWRIALRSKTPWQWVLFTDPLRRREESLSVLKGSM